MGGSRRRVDLLNDLKFSMVRTGGNATLIKCLMVKRIFLFLGYGLSYTAQKKSFPLRIFSVNVTKSAVSCGFGHIY